MILEKEGTSTKKTSVSLPQISRTSENVSKMTSGVQKHKVHSLPSECAYRGEGNANLVIAVPYENKVIRFRKCDPGENYSSDGGLFRVNRERDFIKIVLSPFLEPYLNVPEILRFNRTELDEFSKMIYLLRPEQRRFKQAVEEYATKFPDHAFLPEFLNDSKKSSARSKSTFCVEIKPKQGFISKCDQQFQKCPYCLTQYHKLAKKSISRRSSYCPFDLFSGERNRMRRALKGLLQDPQNNLKIFKDGVVVYDQNSEMNDLKKIFKEWFPNIFESSSNREKHLDLFCSLVQEALLREFPNKNQNLNLNSMAFDINQDIEVLSRLSLEIVAKAKKMLYFTNEECDFTSTDLPQGSVLKRILEMQQLHCCGDDIISWIYSKYSAILDDEIIYSSLIKAYKSRGILQRSSIFNNYMNFAINDGYEYSKGDMNKKELQNSIKNSIPLLKQQKICDQNKRKTLENNRLLDQLSADEEIVLLENYLLFCTVRDCSILIAFQEFDLDECRNIHNDYVIQISEELKFLTNVRISDLDPKSVHSIEKHRHRDMQTLKSVIRIIEEELILRSQIQLKDNEL